MSWLSCLSETGKPVPAGDLPYFLFGEIGQGKADAIDRFPLDRMKEVGLVLPRFLRERKNGSACLFLHPCIMTRGDEIKPHGRYLVEQCPEFDMAIAGNTGIRCPSPGILFNKRFHDVLFQVAGEIHGVVGDLHHLADPASVFDLAGPAALCPAALLGGHPEAHGDPHDLVALLFQEQGRNG